MNAPLLTLGYTVAVLTMIRVDEKIGQRIGPGIPMTFGAMSFVVTAILPACTFISDNTTYFSMVLIGMAFQGFGLGLFATPATNAAVGEAPAAKAVAAGGIFKMASSLGGAFGVAIHLAAQYGIGIGAVAALISALTSFWLVPGLKK